MNTTNKKALSQLAESSIEELKKARKKWKQTRVTKLVRFSPISHRSIKQLAKKRKMTMSKTLDHIIEKFFKHQELYEIREKNPNWGDYVCLAEAVKYKKYCRRKIYLYFRTLVDKNDYVSKETNQLVRYLWNLSNTPEEDEFLRDFRFRSNKRKYPNIFSNKHNLNQNKANMIE